MVDLARARAPHDARLYESHYLTAVDPAGGRALWLRHTALHGRPSLWVTWFDGSADARRVELDEPLARGAWPSCSLGSFGPSSAQGRLGGTAWDLQWSAVAEPLPYLPATWLYDRGVLRSQGAAVVPDALVHGRFGDVVVDGWRGVVGHNWGREHAEQWCWLHVPLEGGWLDLVLVRIRVGPVLLPWNAGGGLHVDGVLHRTRPGRVSLVADGSRTVARVPLRGGGLVVETEAPYVAAWDYASPSGRGRDVTNCSVADARVALDDGRSWEVRGTAAVEHGH